MNKRTLLKILSLLSIIEGISMLPSYFCALYYHEGKTKLGFLIPLLSMIILGSIIYLLFKNTKSKLGIRDGFFIATLTWVYCSILGAIPFFLSGMGYSPFECIFEAVSGFTTTGANTVNLDLMPHSLLLWRATLNYLGGMGILVLLISIFPALGIGGQSLVKLETTGPVFQKLGTKTSNTGRILYLTYFALTVLEFIFLSLGDLGTFDALINTFSTISTGGIYVRGQSILAFGTSYVRVVILIFTILSSLNYTLYFSILSGKFKDAIKNVEARVFLAIIGISSVLITSSLVISGKYTNILLALRDATFEVVSFISTSGYFICDFSKWPTFSISILFLLLFIGGCQMSTTGSLKVVRIITLVKLAQRGIYVLIHPHSVRAIKIGDEVIPADRVSTTTTHVLLYFFCLVIGTILLSFNNMPLDETLTTALGVFTNTGVNLSTEGINGYLGNFNGFSQFIMCILMIAGRLEIYSIFILFTSAFWKNNKSDIN